jgi:hypothetical protein
MANKYSNPSVELMDEGVLMDIIDSTSSDMLPAQTYQ